MLFITITFRLIHAGPNITYRILNDVTHSVGKLSPTRAHRLIITDDLDTAVIQARDKNSSKIHVILIDLENGDRKTHIFKKVLIIPYMGMNLSNEISNVIAGN